MSCTSMQRNVSTVCVPGPLVRLRHLADAVPREEVVGEVELLEVRQDRVQLGQALVVNVGVGQVETSDPTQTTFTALPCIFLL